MAKPYIPSTPPARIDFAPDHASITESITVPPVDSQGRCRVELDYSIRSAADVVVTIDGVVLIAVRYGTSVDPGEVGITFVDVPILEFHPSLASKTGTIQYAPLSSVRTASWENAIQNAISDLMDNPPTVDGYDGLNPNDTLFELCMALHDLGLINFANPPS